MAYVYILECADGTYYTGSTLDLERRLAEHEFGGANYTRERRPVRLIWHASFERVDDAFGWEKRIQGWSRAKKRALIEGRYADLPGWSAVSAPGGGADRRVGAFRLASLAQRPEHSHPGP